MTRDDILLMICIAIGAIVAFSAFGAAFVGAGVGLVIGLGLTRSIHRHPLH
jgi:hypothetical protein